MKQKIFIALFALGLSVVLHGYLTAHYYPLQLGFGGAPSLCSVGAKFDCDAVSASPYAAIFGIPVAAFGAVYNLILFVMVLFNWLGLRGDSARNWREPFWMSIGSVAATLIMGTITLTKLSSACLFCIGAYVLSLIAFGALLLAQSESPWKFLGSDLRAWFTEQKSFLLWLAAVPIGAGLVHIGMMQNYGAEELSRVVKGSINDWQTGPSVTWTATPSLTKGASVENAKLTLTEFADFRCGHCKHAAPSLKAFVNANPDVRLVFYSFPLDSTCNPALKHGDGISCHLAKLVICAAQQDRGWQAHDQIFENQEKFQALSTPETINTELKSRMTEQNLDWAAMNTCLKDPATEANLRAQAEQGVAAKVMGTPSIYANGKKLEKAQLLPVLSALKASLSDQK
ncbi:MAG: vitamin K epoxide reductase family protein [Bdellovibrionales bacterium]